jgi:hypothetical protein
MEACEKQGFGVESGTRRKTVSPGAHGASSLDQGTVSSALVRNAETVERWISESATRGETQTRESSHWT